MKLLSIIINAFSFFLFIGHCGTCVTIFMWCCVPTCLLLNWCLYWEWKEQKTRCLYERCIWKAIIACLSTIGCLFSHCCVAPLHVAGCVHVDVDGGCGPVCCTGESVHYSYWTIHCWLHHHKLWLVVKTIRSLRTEYEFPISFSSGLPLVYMAVVVPIGFLVNTDDIGNHYGQYNSTSGELLV